MNFAVKVFFVSFALLFLIIGCGSSKEDLVVKTSRCGSNMKFVFRPIIKADFSYLRGDTISIKNSVMINSVDSFLVKIKYPDYAVKNGIEGIVIIDFIVNEVGIVDGIKLVKSIGGGCEGTFIEELKKQKFKPATLNNKPISEWISVKVKFSLI